MQFGANSIPFEIFSLIALQLSPLHVFTVLAKVCRHFRALAAGLGSPAGKPWLAIDLTVTAALDTLTDIRFTWLDRFEVVQGKLAGARATIDLKPLDLLDLSAEWCETKVARAYIPPARRGGVRRFSVVGIGTFRAKFNMFHHKSLPDSHARDRLVALLHSGWPGLDDPSEWEVGAGVELFRMVLPQLQEPLSHLSALSLTLDVHTSRHLESLLRVPPKPLLQRLHSLKVKTHSQLGELLDQFDILRKFLEHYGASIHSLTVCDEIPLGWTRPVWSPNGIALAPATISAPPMWCYIISETFRTLVHLDVDGRMFLYPNATFPAQQAQLEQLVQHHLPFVKSLRIVFLSPTISFKVHREPLALAGPRIARLLPNLSHLECVAIPAPANKHMTYSVSHGEYCVSWWVDFFAKCGSLRTVHLKGLAWGDVPYYGKPPKPKEFADMVDQTGREYGFRVRWIGP